MKTFLKPILGLLTTVGLFYQHANARPIAGSIDFGGVVTYIAGDRYQGEPLEQLLRFGDFSGIAAGTSVTMAASWIFKSGTPAMPMPGPATPALWSVGGFTFDLTSSSVVPPQSANFLNITGTGFISTYTNLDRTPGVWTFSSSNSNGSDHTTFGFQATTDPVPEGPPPIVSWSTADAIPLPCVGVQPAWFAIVGSPSLSVVYHSRQGDKLATGRVRLIGRLRQGAKCSCSCRS